MTNLSWKRLLLIFTIIFRVRGKTLMFPTRICTSEACLTAAKSISESIDHSVDPCDDFYTYACGNWIRSHPVPLTETHWNQFDILESTLDKEVHLLMEEPIVDDDLLAVKAVKTIYKSCMNQDKIEENGVQPLTDLLNKLGGWPIAGWPKYSSSNFWALIAKTTKLLAVTPLLFAYVDVDRKNTQRHILTIDQPSLTLPRYAFMEKNAANLEAYVRFIQNAAVEVGKASGYQVNSFRINLEALEILKFETKLASITTKEEFRRDAKKMYKLITIGKLQQLSNGLSWAKKKSQINWIDFLSGIVGDESHISDDTEVVITDMEYLKNLLTLLELTPIRVIVNYIQWRVVRTMSKDLNERMRELNFRFKQQMSHVKNDHPRWRDCVLSTSYMSLAVGYVYVEKYFGKHGKEKALDMVENIRFAFREELQGIEWMDNTTKRAALEKADFMISQIGFPDWFNNSSALNHYYHGLQIGTDHFANIVRLREFLVRKMVRKLNVAANRDEWQTSPAVVNAFYNPYVNSIIFPAGILQRPFFSFSLPSSLNYGSIGAIIGHEITHGFDDVGRQSDKTGNINQWWTEETEKTYLKNAQCFIDQYQNFRVPELDNMLRKKVTMNGVLTLGENIADNGGLKSAYRAFKKQINDQKDLVLPGLEKFNSDQLFFLGFANVWCESPTLSSLMSDVMGDTHSPHKYRVIGSLSNSEEFSIAWKCPKGSKMNPNEKCHIW